jgi:hypothetical protein
MNLDVAGEHAGDRLMKQVRYYSRNAIPDGVEAPTEKQVAVVLHALADHTAIMEALKHRVDPDSPWPQANSIGRWFHDVADSLEYKDLQK